MPYKRVCKNHRRWPLSDWEGKPVWCAKYGEPTRASDVLPRGKAYPYSSVRQQSRDYRKLVAISHEAAIDWLKAWKWT